MNFEEFIRSKIGSLNELRVLLLFRASPGLDWDVPGISGKLYLRPAEAQAAVTALAGNDLLVPAEKPQHYRYQPKSEELARLVEQLVEVDRNHPVTLIHMIYDRTRDIQAFADAFRLKKENGEKGS